MQLVQLASSFCFHKCNFVPLRGGPDVRPEAPRREPRGAPRGLHVGAGGAVRWQDAAAPRAHPVQARGGVPR